MGWRRDISAPNANRSAGVLVASRQLIQQRLRQLPDATRSLREICPGRHHGFICVLSRRIQVPCYPPSRRHNHNTNPISPLSHISQVYSDDSASTSWPPPAASYMRVFHRGLAPVFTRRRDILTSHNVDPQATFERSNFRWCGAPAGAVRDRATTSPPT